MALNMPSISIRQVEVIRAVLKARSISGAARLLNVSPAAVSRMLRHTESQIGFALFSRTTSGFVPTPEARDLVDDLEQVHSGLHRIQTRLSAGRERPVLLRIGSSPGLGMTVVPRALARMRRKAPDFQFELGALHVDEVLTQLEFRRYDFAMTIYEIDDPRLSIRTLARAPFVCLMPEDHPLAEHDTVSLHQIARHDLIGYDPASFQQRLIDRFFSDLGLTPFYVARCRLMNTACALTQERIGLTLLDQFTVFDRPPQGTRAARVELDFRFPLNVITLTEAPLSVESERFLKELEDLTTESFPSDAPAGSAAG